MTDLLQVLRFQPHSEHSKLVLYLLSLFSANINSTLSSVEFPKKQRKLKTRPLYEMLLRSIDGFDRLCRVVMINNVRGTKRSK